MDCEVGQIWYAEFRFEDQPDLSKRRPVLIVKNDDLKLICVALKITSKERYGRTGYKIKYWENSGLTKQSWVDLSQRQTFRHEELIHYLGELDQRDQMNIWYQLAELYQ